MSSFGVLASMPEEHFQCPICTKVFSDPVTTPCGHNFCKTCLSKCWDGKDACSCPMCNKRFYMRPEISTNSVIQEISVQIKKRKVEALISADAPWGVKCDVCKEVKFKALKSCLVCLTSYCVHHLEPHQRVPSLMRHKMVEPVEDLEERTCEKHQRILELFCRDEQTCICLLCSETDHKDHETVPVEEEGARQKENIELETTRIKSMIEDRTEKIKEFADSSEMSKEKANKEILDSDKLFNTLTDRVRVAQTTLRANIDTRLRKSQEKHKGMIEELEKEVAQLQRKHSELERLSQNGDYFRLLQALSTKSDTQDWSNIRVYSDLYVQTLRRTMTCLVNMFQSELKTLTDAELTRMRQYKELVTFDPATAGRHLVVSEFGKRLKHNKNADPPTSHESERFDRPIVLGSKGFTSGRHYWEVQVGLRSDWDVGVARESVTRKGSVEVKKENGFFAIGKSGFGYQVFVKSYNVLHLSPRPRNLGVYLEYDAGRVSFYDVDRSLHLYSFTGESFTEKLFPYFYLYSGAKKAEPLLIRSMQDRASLLSLIHSFQQAKE